MRFARFARFVVERVAGDGLVCWAKGGTQCIWTADCEPVVDDTVVYKKPACPGPSTQTASEVLDEAADSTVEVRAEVRHGSARRVYALVRGPKAWKGGMIAWIMSSVMLPIYDLISTIQF